MVKYYYSSEGRTLGPVSPNEIMSLILDDKITTESYVMRTKSPQWIKIADLPDLMRFLHESEINLSLDDEGAVKLVEYDADAPLFFYIPLSKLLLYIVVSQGLYEIYWFHENWKFLRYRRQGKIALSFWRIIINPLAIVDIFHKISLDKEMNAALPCRRDFGAIGGFWYVVVYLVLLITALVYSGLGTFVHVNGNMLVIVSILAALALTYGFLARVQNYVNAVNAKLGKRFSKPSVGHYLTLVVGIMGWISQLAIILVLLF